MAAGEQFSPKQVSDLERAIDIAEKTSGLEFGAYVGSLPRGRVTAEALHAAMPSSANSVLVAVDPDASTVDIVTGHIARRWLDDSRCRLAVLTMGSRFSVGDIPAGIHDGIILLGDQAVHPRSLFTDEERTQRRREGLASEARLRRIPEERERERRAIDERNTGRVEHTFPGAVLLLVPESLATRRKS